MGAPLLAPLGTPSGSPFGAPLLAQQRPPTDTTRRPAPPGPPAPALPAPAVPMPAGDSAAADSVPPRDTVKAPLAVAFRPAVPTIRGRRTIWDREAIFASGALTLTDLLAQVQGVTAFYAGYIAAPQIATWYGQPGRIRVFLDGVELDGLDLREGNVRDLSVIQLWPLEEVAVERAAGELRVYLRSWRVILTTAQTRTDVTTGSEQTNLYRGFFGKRMNSGAVVQFAAQQYSTTSIRTAGDGDALAGFGRIGMARGRLTIDAVGTRFGRNRNSTYRGILTGTPDQDAIGAFEGRDAVGYLRAAWGDADTSTFWMQGIWAGMLNEQRGDTGVLGDTLRAGSQYIATAGLSRWGARLSATARYRVHGGAGPRFAPSVRASWERDWFTVSAHAEESGPDSTRRLDGLATITPFPWLHFMAAHSIHTPQKRVGVPARTISRVEAAARVYGRWLSVAAVQRSAGTMLGARVFDTTFVDSTIAKNTGLEAGIAGPLWGPFSFEWRGITWETVQPWHPHVESHAEIRITPDTKKRFPRGTFDFTAGFTHDYRGEWDIVTASGRQVVQGAGFIGGFIEMRIGAARIFWYNRNATGKIYETVPGYVMPRLVQLYGVRWEFWN